MKQKPIYVYHAILPDGRETELEKADLFFCNNCSAIGYCAFLGYVDLCASHPFFTGRRIKRLTGQRVKA